MKNKTIKEIAQSPVYPTLGIEDVEGVGIACTDNIGLTKFEYFAAKFTVGFLASGDGYDTAVKGGIEAAKEFMQQLSQHSF